MKTLHKEGPSQPFESRGMSWVVADTMGADVLSQSLERMGSGMVKWNHSSLDTREETCWCAARHPHPVGQIRTVRLG